MNMIDAMKCVYDTKSGQWAVEVLYADGKKTHRFNVAGAPEARAVADSFQMASASLIDVATAEIHFIFEPHGEDIDMDDDEDDESESAAPRP
jgi:hypothetical protein